MSPAEAAVDDPAAERLRHALVEELTAKGCLRSPAWREAFRRVPRHGFLPAFFRPDGAGGYTPVDSAAPERRQEWLRLVYRDEAWVTQLDGDSSAWAAALRTGRVTGTPTCSSTQPGLMATMLEALDIAAAHRVLEIGAGTGYNSALLCERLGSPAVASVDVDPELVEQAAARLAGLGYAPVLAAADGAGGLPGRSPYDRIIATASVPAIPPAWIQQTRPGGLVLANLDRGLGGGALVRLTVGADGAARGRFLADYGSFMPLRAIRRRAAPDLLHEVADVPGRDGPARVNGGVLDDPGFVFFAGLLIPEVARVEVAADDGDWQVWLVGQDGSWAHDDGARAGQTVVRQAGSRRLWDELDAAHAAWEELGKPARHRFGLTVTHGSRHLLWVDEASDDLGWDLLAPLPRRGGASRPATAASARSAGAPRA